MHKQLEREVHPEAVEVDIHTKEEFWAARYIISFDRLSYDQLLSRPFQPCQHAELPSKFHA